MRSRCWRRPISTSGLSQRRAAGTCCGTLWRALSRASGSSSLALGAKRSSSAGCFLSDAHAQFRKLVQARPDAAKQWHLAVQDSVAPPLHVPPALRSMVDCSRDMLMINADLVWSMPSEACDSGAAALLPLGVDDDTLLKALEDVTTLGDCSTPGVATTFFRVVCVQPEVKDAVRPSHVQAQSTLVSISILTVVSTQPLVLDGRSFCLRLLDLRLLLSSGWYTELRRWCARSVKPRTELVDSVMQQYLALVDMEMPAILAGQSGPLAAFQLVDQLLSLNALVGVGSPLSGEELRALGFDVAPLMWDHLARCGVISLGENEFGETTLILTKRAWKFVRTLH